MEAAAELARCGDVRAGEKRPLIPSKTGRVDRPLLASFLGKSAAPTDVVVVVVVSTITVRKTLVFFQRP